jgi:hypothetical protein
LGVGNPQQIRTAQDQMMQGRLPLPNGSQPDAQPFPVTGTPSFSQAAGAGALPGSANALSPGLNKAGKLITLLTSGLQGALAGRAANEQATVASGGRRSGGAGMGFEAGYQLPWQRAGMAQQYEQEQAKTQLLKSQAEMVPTQYGPMPAALARYILPAEIRGEATVKGQQIGAGAKLGAAGIMAGKPVVVPGRGLFQKDAQGQYQPVQGAEVPSVLVTPEEAQSLGHPELANQELDMGRYSQLLRGVSGENAPVQGISGPSLVNKVTKKTTPLGLGSPTQARPTQVADPNTPGGTKMVTGAQSIGMAGPQSASVQVPRAVLKSATSGPIGTQITAFNTALQHADLLQQALGALNSGDNRTLNSLKNRFKTEFGSPDVTNLQAITNAYSREITKMLSAGHMTDAEIGSAGATMPTNASPQQMLGALQAYRSLATSKMQMLQQQVNQGMQGKPNFPANLGGGPVGGVTHVFVPGKGLQPAQAAQ